MCESTACIEFAGIFIFGIVMGLALARKVLWQASKTDCNITSGDATQESRHKCDKNTTAQPVVKHHLNSTEDKSFLTDLLTTMVVISLFFIFILSLEA